MTEQCPCGKDKSFAQCCGRFLSGREVPKTAEQLMRSRFTAYALGGYGDYLLNTWFPATAQGLTAEQLSHRELNWQKLEVLSKSQQGDEATVEFKAYYLPKASSSPGDGSPAIGDQHGLMHEVSEFRRVSGRWYYIGGRVM